MNLCSRSRERRFSKPVSAAPKREPDFFNPSIHSALPGVSFKGVDQHYDMRCLWVCPRCRAAPDLTDASSMVCRRSSTGPSQPLDGSVMSSLQSISVRSGLSADLPSGSLWYGPAPSKKPPLRSTASDFFNPSIPWVRRIKDGGFGESWRKLVQSSSMSGLFSR